MRKLIMIAACVLVLSGCAGTPAAQHSSTPSHSVTKVATTTFANNVVGLTYADAYRALGALGLVVSLDVADPNVTAHPTFYLVKSQVPAGNTKVKNGSTVFLHVEAVPITVPNVVGQTLSQAESSITSASGDLTATSDPAASPTWPVQSQNPAAGATVTAGAAIALTASVPQVVFSVWGNGSTSNVVTYTIPGSFDIEQASDASLPWSMSFPYAGTDSLAYGNLSAQDDDGTSISCAISANGKIVDQQTATGQYAIVQCGG